MSFVHVLGTIGKDALSIGAKAVPLIPGPIGFIAGTALQVANQEVTNKSGPEKKDAVMSVAVAMSPDHPNKIQIISGIVENCVQILNAIAQLFPPK